MASRSLPLGDTTTICILRACMHSLKGFIALQGPKWCDCYLLFMITIFIVNKFKWKGGDLGCGVTTMNIGDPFQRS